MMRLYYHDKYQVIKLITNMMKYIYIYIYTVMMNIMLSGSHKHCNMSKNIETTDNKKVLRR